MRRVDAAFRKDVDPQVFEHERSALEIKRQFFRKCRDMPIKRIPNLLKYREAPGKVREA